MSYNEKLRCDNLTTNHEGAQAWRMTPEWELYSTVVTTMGVEDKFYERGEDRVRRIADLVRKVQPEFVAQLAIYARESMHLRSVPLLLLTELAQCHHGDSLVSRTVARTVQRADEITELLMCYQWRTGKKDLKGLSNQLRKGLAEAFNHFDEYQFAKYNRKDRKATLRDALQLVHPVPKDDAQAALFGKILDDSLETPYTWETKLSDVGQQHFESAEEKAKSKRAAWAELVCSLRMGYMATLRNLRNIVRAKLDDESMQKVCDYIADPEAVRKSKQLPFRFLSAYIQLSGYGRMNNHQLNIRSVQEKVCVMENVLGWRKNGYFHVRTRKVYAFHPESAACIVNRVAIPTGLAYSRHRMHRRRLIRVRKHYSQLSVRQQAEISRLERVLDKLKRREENMKRAPDKWTGNQTLKRTLQALETAARMTAANIPCFNEDTRILLASDTSGSMYQPVSKNSSVMCFHIGLLLSMLMKQRCKNVVAGMFGDFWKAIDMPSENILQSTIDMIRREGEVGYSTNGYKVIDWLIEEKKVMDKVMFFTDCQLWDSCWGGNNLQESWNKYKQIAPNARLYLFDLAGYGQSPISMERDDVFCIAGWSDKVFDILQALERGNSAIDEIRRIVV